MLNLLRYIMGLNALNQRLNFTTADLDVKQVAILDAFMAKFPRWGGWFLPPLTDKNGNILMWRGGKRF